MKKTAVAFLLYSTSLPASDFYLRMHDNSTFTVLFNQSIYNYSCKNFMMQNIVPGNYPVEIYNNCYLSPCQIPIYKGTVKIPTSTMVMGCIDPFNRLSVTASPAMLIAGAMDPRRSGNKHIVETLDLNDSTSFSKAKEVLSGNGTQETKIWFLKRCIFFHGISAERLAEVMLLLSFDTGRLDIAKSSYWYTFNREEYYKVYDSFIFSSTRRELEDYLMYTIVRGY
jgi:hypothetical protein